MKKVQIDVEEIYYFVCPYKSCEHSNETTMPPIAGVVKCQHCGRKLIDEYY